MSNPSIHIVAIAYYRTINNENTLPQLSHSHIYSSDANSALGRAISSLEATRNDPDKLVICSFSVMVVENGEIKTVIG